MANDKVVNGKDVVMVKPEDTFSAFKLLNMIKSGVEVLRSKLDTETDEVVKQTLRGAITAYVELHTVLLEQVRSFRIEEGGNDGSHYDA